MDSNNTKVVYVTWVRHCESCSNVASAITQPVRKVYVEPLCTSNGISIAIRSGEVLREELKSVRKVAFYASVLPRAMQTAKLMSDAFLPTKPIQRLCHVSEYTTRLEPNWLVDGVGSANSTTRERSDRHARFLNRYFERIGAPIEVNSKDVSRELRDCCERDGNNNNGTCRVNGDSYRRFISGWLRKRAEPNTMHVIVSHREFIARHVLKGTGLAKPQNNDMYVVRYKLRPNRTFSQEVVRIIPHAAVTQHNSPAASSFESCTYSYADVVDFTPTN